MQPRNIGGWTITVTRSLALVPAAKPEEPVEPEKMVIPALVNLAEPVDRATLVLVLLVLVPLVLP
jgi:hypothetical protein